MFNTYSFRVYHAAALGFSIGGTAGSQVEAATTVLQIFLFKEDNEISHCNREVSHVRMTRLYALVDLRVNKAINVKLALNCKGLIQMWVIY